MKKEAGFSAIEFLLVVVVIGLLAGLGFMFYKRQHKSVTPSSVTVSKTQTVAPTAGTAASIDSLTSQDAASESSIDQKHTSSESTTAQSSNAAAANLGGAYNESSL